MKSPTNVERLEEIFNFGKIVRVAICVTNGYRKMKNVMHHACLKDIFEKLVVVNGPTCLNLENPPLIDGMSVSIEALQDLAFAPKKHRNNYLVFARLPFLDSKSEFLKAWAESYHNGIAMLVYLFSRIDSIRHLLEKCDYMKAELRRR